MVKHEATLNLETTNVLQYIKELGHASIPDYQQWYGLKADNIIGPKTTTQLMEPRCGCPDFMGGPEMAKWPDTCRDVPTAYEMNFNSVSDAIIDEAWLMGINAWNLVCGINMTVVDGLSNGKIWARSGALPGSTLAWSFLANDRCNTRLEQRYDTTVTWDLHFLAKTIMHEIGHAIGLQHSNRREDIMFPSITGNPWSSYPSNNDIARVVSRYDEPVAVPPDPDPVPEEEILFEYIAKFEGEKISLVTSKKGWQI